MKIYLAGPMSGIPQFNYPAFDEAADLLRSRGYDVMSPAEMDDPNIRAAALASPNGEHRVFQDTLKRQGHQPETWGDFLSRDVKLVSDEVDAIVLMADWQRSRGARTEAFIALQTQKPVFFIYEGDIYEHDPADVMDHIARNTMDQGDVSYYEE